MNTTNSSQYIEQITNGISEGISAGITLYIIILLFSLAVFALHVAVATIVVKKIWYSNIGGGPRYYR